jgi:hypothetical protein
MTAGATTNTLPPDALRERFEQSIVGHLDECIAVYRHKHGAILTPANALNLCRAYKESLETRAFYGSALMPIAGQLLVEVWRAILSDPVVPKDKPAVLFIGAGAGAGITTLLEKPFETLRVRASVLYDATLTTMRDRIERIEEGDRSGRTVLVVYIHRHLARAVRNAVQRALRGGVAMPVRTLAEDHYYAQQTLLWLSRRYKGSRRVQIGIVNNDHDPRNIKVVQLSAIKKSFYKDANEARRIAWRSFINECQQGEEVPDFIKESFAAGHAE